MTKIVSVNSIPEDEKHRERLHTWVVRLGDALRHLDDRILLNRNPLARLTYVKELAKEHYQAQLHPRGIALRETLVYCIDKIAIDMGNEPGSYRLCQYLLLAKQGLSCRQISKGFGLSREQVSRVYRRRALELLADKLRSLNRNKPRHLSQSTK